MKIEKVDFRVKSRYSLGFDKTGLGSAGLFWRVFRSSMARLISFCRSSSGITNNLEFEIIYQDEWVETCSSKLKENRFTKYLTVPGKGTYALIHEKWTFRNKGGHNRGHYHFDPIQDQAR